MNFISRLIALVAIVAIGAGIYFAVLWMSGALNVKALRQSFSRKA